MKNSFPEKFCIIDVETTGMRAVYSRIIDIAIIRVENGKVVKRYETLINPQVKLPYTITQLTHIHDEDLAGAPLFEDVALEIEEILRDAVFVAHNVTFDYSFVQQEFSRLGISYAASKLCSVNLSRTLYPNERAHNLDAIINRFDIRMTSRHRAMPDAEAVLSFFKKMSKDIHKDVIRAAIEKSMNGRSPRTSHQQLPESPGVYFFYGKEQELLYIGKSKNIRTRVRSHFQKSESGKAKALTEETGIIDSIKTSGELSALLLESSFIKNERPIFNRQLVKRKTLVVVKRTISTPGYASLTIDRVTKLDGKLDIVGIFRTAHDAKKKIEELCLKHSLCTKLCGIERTQGHCFNFQLKKCNGACMGEEDAQLYNARVHEAFYLRQIHTWPYKGIVRITERSSGETGTVLFINNWLLVNSYTFDVNGYQVFLPPLESFDYDTYKILVRYLYDPRNKSSIEVISKREYESNIEILSNSFDHEVHIN